MGLPLGLILRKGLAFHVVPEEIGGDIAGDVQPFGPEGGCHCSGWRGLEEVEGRGKRKSEAGVPDEKTELPSWD